MVPVRAPDAVIRFWQALLGLAPPRDAGADWAGRDKWITALSPALLDDLAPGLALDAEAVQQARLYGRYQQALQVQVLGWIAQAGMPCVAMKGFAAGFLYYPAPASRLLGDLDILVRRSDVAAVARLLQQQGFRFGAEIERPWGFISDASFVPLHTADGNCNVDLHIQPDSYPLWLSLDCEAVFAQARQVMAGAQPVMVPSAEHMALIWVANLAKDKFAPNGLRKLLDLARLLRHEHDFSWPSVRALAMRARLGKALNATIFLLRGFDTPDALLPPELGHLHSATATELLADWCSQREPSLMQRLRREWRLAAEPGIALRLLARRTRGLVRPRRGVPEDV